MSLKENLLIYTVIGIVFYLYSTLEYYEYIELFTNIISTIVIAKTCEFISYKVTRKFSLNFFQSLLFSLTYLFFILVFLKFIGVIGNLKVTIIIASITTIFMVKLSYKREKVLNVQLQKLKAKLEMEGYYEDN